MNVERQAFIHGGKACSDQVGSRILTILFDAITLSSQNKIKKIEELSFGENLEINNNFMNAEFSNMLSSTISAIY